MTKSFEWMTEHGAVIYNPPGIEKHAVFLRRLLAADLGVVKRAAAGLSDYTLRKPGAKWTSTLASVTYSQAGALFPIGG